MASVIQDSNSAVVSAASTLHNPFAEPASHVRGDCANRERDRPKRVYGPQSPASRLYSKLQGAGDCHTARPTKHQSIMRMMLRRFTRLTNAHSKSYRHHVAMQALFVGFYNVSRKHETLGGNTPAMAAGLADKAWSIRELIERAALTR